MKTGVTFNAVLIRRKGEEIASNVDKRSGHAQRGSKAWISHYQKALKEMRASLTQEQIEDIERTRVEWDLKGSPEDVQARYVCSYQNYQFLYMD